MDVGSYIAQIKYTFIKLNIIGKIMKIIKIKYKIAVILFII